VEAFGIYPGFCARAQLADSHDLQAYFNRRVEKLVKKHGKIMVGWDEVLGPHLAADTVIQSWRGQASLAEAAAQGYRSVLSFGYYLDHLYPARVHYANDPMDGKGVLGGEACMWSEYVSPETVDSRIWPTMAAIAERFWSPREVTDVESMYTRMEGVSRSLEWIGWSTGRTMGRCSTGWLADGLQSRCGCWPMLPKRWY